MTRGLVTVALLLALGACARPRQLEFRPVPDAASGVESPDTWSGWLGSVPEQVSVFEADGNAYAMRAGDFWGFVAVSLEILTMGQDTVVIDPTALRVFDADGLELAPVPPDIVATRIGGRYTEGGSYQTVDVLAGRDDVGGVLGRVEGFTGPIELFPGVLRRGRLFYEVAVDERTAITVRIPGGEEIRFEYGYPAIWSFRYQRRGTRKYPSDQRS